MWRVCHEVACTINLPLMEILCGYILRVPGLFILNLQLQFVHVIVAECQKPSLYPTLKFTFARMLMMESDQQ
jgi:hypothetical protein